MIKSLNAHITVIAVCGSGRSKNEASVAEFNFLGIGFNCDGVEDGFILAYGSVDILFADRDVFVDGVFVRAKDLGDDAWISEGQDCHEKIAK